MVVPDETADLLMALLFSVRKIVESGTQDKLRIASAYRDACAFIETIDHECGSAHPCIEACLKRSNIHKNADDAVAAGWMLAAIQVRVGERNLYGWRRLGEIVNRAAHELLLSEQAL